METYTIKLNVKKIWMNAYYIMEANFKKSGIIYPPILNILDRSFVDIDYKSPCNKLCWVESETLNLPDQNEAIPISTQVIIDPVEIQKYIDIHFGMAPHPCTVYAAILKHMMHAIMIYRKQVKEFVQYRKKYWTGIHEKDIKQISYHEYMATTNQHDTIEDAISIEITTNKYLEKMVEAFYRIDHDQLDFILEDEWSSVSRLVALYYHTGIASSDKYTNLLPRRYLSDYNNPVMHRAIDRALEDIGVKYQIEYEWNIKS